MTNEWTFFFNVLTAVQPYLTGFTIGVCFWLVLDRFYNKRGANDGK